MANQFGDGSALLVQVVDVVDAAGNPATLESVPVWTTSDATIFAPVAAADGLSATGTALKEGTVTVTATAGTISASVAITVIAGQAVSFQLQVSLAPPPPPPAV